jgi:hypothetical protein
MPPKNTTRKKSAKFSATSSTVEFNPKNPVYNVEASDGKNTKTKAKNGTGSQPKQLSPNDPLYDKEHVAKSKSDFARSVDNLRSGTAPNIPVSSGNEASGILRGKSNEQVAKQIQEEAGKAVVDVPISKQTGTKGLTNLLSKSAAIARAQDAAEPVTPQVVLNAAAAEKASGESTPQAVLNAVAAERKGESTPQAVLNEIAAERNGESTPQAVLNEVAADRAKAVAGFTLPFDNVDRYTDVWKMCSKVFEAFKGPAKDHTGTSLKVVEAGKKFNIVSLDNKKVYEDKSHVDTAILMSLFRYRDLVEQTSKKTFSQPADFFNELEANREYHARACVTLCPLNEDDLPKGLVESLKVADMDALDVKLFNENKKGKPFSVYEKAFLVVEMMVKMAEWELTWLGDALFQEKYITAIVTPDQNKDLPSHLRILSMATKDVKSMYPQSLTINYSMFYPLFLYPTGIPPKVGERTYPDGRVVPFYDTNEKGRELEDGWHRSESQKLKVGQSFYYKNSGEATWNNPIDTQNPELVLGTDGLPTAAVAQPAAEAVSPAAEAVSPAAQPVSPAAEPISPAAEPISPVELTANKVFTTGTSV